MRISRSDSRISINSQNEEELFARENAYYTTYNQHPVHLCGHQFVNIYKNINLQIMLTRRCNLSCPFCIERGAVIGGKESDQIYESISSVLQEYNQQGVFPGVSLTGGEPTVNVMKLKKTIHEIRRFKTTAINLNTNGFNLASITRDGLNINLSVQDINSAHNVNGCVVQKVITEKTTIEFILAFIEYYMKEGAVGFSFRGLSTMPGCGKRNNVFYDILQHFADYIPFVQQKIGDHYLYEVYKYQYKSIPIRFTYSNFDILYKQEIKERSRGQVFSRATVILPNGSVYSGWNYNLNVLFDPENP